MMVMGSRRARAVISRRRENRETAGISRISAGRTDVHIGDTLSKRRDRRAFDNGRGEA